MKVQPDPAGPSATNLPASQSAKPFAETLKLAAAVRPGPKPVVARPTAKPPLSPPKAPAQARPEPKPAAPLPRPPAPKPTAPESRPTSTKAALAVTQMKMRAASQIHRAIVESRTKSSRQLAASRAVDQVHASAHAASAKSCVSRQSERAEDCVRVGLFQAIERECVQAPTSRHADRHSEPERAAVPQTDARSEIPPSATSEAPTQAPTSAQRAESVAALVERIEAALKDGQPTLSLGLADRSGASSIEIARTGKGEVAVRVSARSGRKAHLEAAGEEIRSALAARGLRLKSLEVA